MPFVNTREIVADAAKGGYAVPAFNAYNLECAHAVIRVAERLHAPVIVQLYRRLFESELGGSLAAAIKHLAWNSGIPIALHLDHGETEKDCVGALRAGCGSVMIDGSKLSFEENIALTAGVAERCGYVNVPVEGELGHVGSASLGEEDVSAAYTDPAEAEQFCRRTGVFMLAVMVGSAHGIYKKAPKLDIGRIAAIRKSTGAPLVLHGGSGIPDEEIREAVRAGICKINVATDICQAYYEGFRHLKADDAMYAKALDLFAGPAMAQVERLVEDKILLFGAADRCRRQ